MTLRLRSSEDAYQVRTATFLLCGSTPTTHNASLLPHSRPSSAAGGQMRTNERTTERTNQQTNEYDGSHYLLAEVIKGAFLMNLCIVFIWATRAHIGVGDGGRVISSPQNRQKIFSGKYRVKSVHFVTFFTYIYSASQKISPEVFWHFPPYTCSWEFFDQNLHACYRFQSTLEHTFLFNYLQL